MKDKEKLVLNAKEKRWHVTSLLITILFLLYGFLCARYSWYRAFKEAISVLLSAANYFLTVMGFKGVINVTVNDIPDVPFVPFLPFEPEQFKSQLAAMWHLLFTKENFFIS